MSGVRNHHRLLAVVVVSVTLFAVLIYSSFFISSSLLSMNAIGLDAIGRHADVSPSLRQRAAQAPPDNDRLWKRGIWDAPTTGTEMLPPLGSFRLTKEMASYRAQDNVVIVTFGNYAFMDFVVNWVRHLTDLKITNILVGAMDVKLLEGLYRQGLPVFDMQSDMDPTDVGWGSKGFHQMGRQKVILIDTLLRFGFEVLMCDTDMVWLKNPLPYIARYPEADVLTSSDTFDPTVTDDSLEVWYKAYVDYNIGIFHWRPTGPARRLVKEWKETLLADEELWDQSVFNDLTRRRIGPQAGDDGLFFAYDGTLKLGVLPTSFFCSGYSFFIDDLPHKLRTEPYAAHTTFQYGGTDGKRHRLREAMLFYDPPQYYDSPGGFLSFEQRIPASLLLYENNTIESHFKLVNYQLKNIKTAFAVASLLNRTLVMPPLWCKLQTDFVDDQVASNQPFLCPMDNVLKVDKMMAELPEAKYGPKIDFREYSFLENPFLPKQVKKSALEVKLCDETPHTHCQAGRRPGVLTFPRNSSEDKVVEVFSSYKDIKVLHFSSIDDAFRGFSTKEREEQFRRRMNSYTGHWCCTEDRADQDGEFINYDMFWDEKPEWKPLPRSIESGKKERLVSTSSHS